MGTWSVWHWVVVLIVLVLLFGSKKLPDAARGLGRSLRILKSEVRQMNAEDGHDVPAEAHTTAPAAPAQPAAVTAAPAEQPAKAEPASHAHTA
jgi:sec-independent protein translocase protein TatA